MNWEVTLQQSLVQLAFKGHSQKLANSGRDEHLHLQLSYLLSECSMATNLFELDTIGHCLVAGPGCA